ncbi:MAG: T9SS type A sorting domain-containing protein, partial [Bacteroidota bacterium]
DSSLFHSTGLSSNQVLPNENLLVLSGRWGRAFELTPDNEIVWDYVIPIRAGQPISQGEVLGINNNITFQMRRYAPDYAAFTDRELSFGELLELNAGDPLCNSVVSIDPQEEINIKIFPNPVIEELSIENLGTGVHTLQILDLLGKVIIQQERLGSEARLSVANLSAGMYVLQVDGETTFKFLKQ